jgi:ABC-type antimicrobial peptide transport system permease subunit
VLKAKGILLRAGRKCELSAKVRLVLAIIGIYGTMAFAVSRKTAEIGIRVALGASQGQVLRSVLAGSLANLLLGAAIGIGLALGAAQPLASFLAEGVTAHDPLTFGCVILVCLAAGLIAALVPARRALSVSPMLTLRMD